MSSGFLLTALSALLCAVFAVLALWHLYMASRPSIKESSAVPSVNGKPLFVPSRRSTVLVAIVLCLFAVLVAATAGWLATGLPPYLLRWASYALALGLLARAVGDFKYVGFFKTVRSSPFAKSDTLLYSPLCLLLSAGVAAVTFGPQ